MKIQNILILLFAVMVIGVATYFILGELFLPTDKPQEGICMEYPGEWERVTATGTREPVEVPGKCEAERNEVVVLETKLPETIEYNRVLCFRSAKQDMKFYIDGKLRKEYSTEETRLFGKMSAASYVFLEISEEDDGKILRVETQTDSAYSGTFYTVYYGNQMGIWNYFFEHLGLELVISIVTLILSVIAIIGSVALRFCYRKRIPLEYLGWGILLAAVWLITNSAFRQLIFPNLSVVNDITFLMIMLLPLPFLFYVNEIQRARYQKIYYVMESILIFNFILCSGLHISGLCDFTDTIGYISVFCVLAIGLMAGTILLELRRGYTREYPFVAVGMLGVCIASVVQIIIYFLRINMFNGVSLEIGLIFLLICSIINTVREFMHLEREKKKALSASESKGRFLANMSHEIRTPINAVLGMDAMILRESKETQIREYALDIQNAGQTLLSLINDILDISKIESGKLEIIPVEYDFSSLIHDLMNMVGMRAQEKGLELNLSVDESLPSRLWGDDVRLRQILVNLMNNAVKYTEKGSVTLSVSAAIQEEMAELTFRVEDTGIGIREEDMEKLFREFERIEEQRNRNIEGTGLGMSITLQLLELMESKLQVESVYGKGSVFYFTLRQKIISHEPIGDLEQRIKNQASSYSYQVMFTAPEARVLVVDDNKVNRRVFVNLLKTTEIKIDEAAGGEQCLELVRENFYDLILLDHMMPDLDGIEVLHTMREWEDYPCKDTPVIVLTANAVTGAREMYLKEGFDDFLSKPVNPDKLEKIVMEFLPENKVIYGEGKTAYPDMDIEDSSDEMTLPELEGIDWNYAQLYCRDMDILKDTVNQFYDTIGAEAVQLEDYMAMLRETEDESQVLNLYRVKVHSMKNSAAMIGAVSLAGVARMLEYAARDAKVDVIENVTPAFLQDWRGMKEILKSVVEREKPDEKKEKADYEFTKELLNLLRHAIGDMDVDTADEIMKELKKFTYSDKIMTEVMENLSLAVTNLDEEQTVVWSNKFEQELR
ncbi:MAG: response regulator [Lachnospiraceae bacterium]|nr:response regulator [Lachnospiraceae bacterium]